MAGISASQGGLGRVSNPPPHLPQGLWLLLTLQIECARTGTGCCALTGSVWGELGAAARAAPGKLWLTGRAPLRPRLQHL